MSHRDRVLVVALWLGLFALLLGALLATAGRL